MKEISKFASTQAIKEVKCPLCGSVRRTSCKTPKGKKIGIHAERSKKYHDKIGHEEFMKRHIITL